MVTCFTQHPKIPSSFCVFLIILNFLCNVNVGSLAFEDRALGNYGGVDMPHYLFSSQTKQISFPLP